jgi:hypothetical protein
MAVKGDPGTTKYGLTLQPTSRLSPEEVLTGRRLASQEALDLMESPHIGADYVDQAGRSYDAMGTPKAYQYFNQRDFLGAIDDHLLKSNDLTVIDLSGATAGQRLVIRAYVAGLGLVQRSKIVFVGD